MNAKWERRLKFMTPNAFLICRSWANSDTSFFFRWIKRSLKSISILVKWTIPESHLANVSDWNVFSLHELTSFQSSIDIHFKRWHSNVDLFFPYPTECFNYKWNFELITDIEWRFSFGCQCYVSLHMMWAMNTFW